MLLFKSWIIADRGTQKQAKFPICKMLNGNWDFLGYDAGISTIIIKL